LATGISVKLDLDIV